MGEGQRGEDRSTAAERFRRIHAAFEDGDIAALRAAVEDPDAVPNGQMPPSIGGCLCYAVYHSPLSFIRELLALGADPNGPDPGGFPPIFAALSCVREAPGAPRRPDVDDILRALLNAGADPNQRGINDYTALHMAVAEGSALSLYRLLEAGADPEVRTRIDDCDTPAEMAAAGGRADLAAILEHRGRPPKQRLRAGLQLVWEVPGDGPPVRRQRNYRTRLRLWTRDGTPIVWPPAAPGYTEVDPSGEELTGLTRINRGHMMNGLFYGVEGMCVGGTRRLEMASWLVYGDRGVPGTIPPGTALRAEITVLAALDDAP